MDESGEINLEPYVGLGALGGMIGTALVVAIAAIYLLVRFGTENLDGTFVIMGLFGLAGGAIAGVAVGLVIYKFTRSTKAQPNAAVRIAIGAGCLLVFGVLTSMTTSQPFHPTFEIGYALTVGGLAGLMSRVKMSSASDQLSHNRA